VCRVLGVALHCVGIGGVISFNMFFARRIIRSYGENGGKKDEEIPTFDIYPSAQLSDCGLSVLERIVGGILKF
jgi:hypothetical protein